MAKEKFGYAICSNSEAEILIVVTEEVNLIPYIDLHIDTVPDDLETIDEIDDWLRSENDCYIEKVRLI